MNPATTPALRVSALCEVAEREVRSLLATDRRLFAVTLTPELMAVIQRDDLRSEQIDAFAARFSRLQDTLGDKLLPAVLALAAEPVAAALDNLDRAERLGLLPSADAWLALRKLRYVLVHEYLQAPGALLAALEQAHAFVPVLCTVQTRLVAEAQRLLAARLSRQGDGR